MAEIKANAVYTTKETQKLLKVSSSTIKRMIKHGLLRANKIGSQYRIFGHELFRLLSPEVESKAVDIYQKIKHSAREKTKDW